MKISKYIRSKLLWALRFSRGDIAIYEGKRMKFVWIPSSGEVYAWDYKTGNKLIFENW